MRRTGKAIGTLAAATAMAMLGSGVAFADAINDNVVAGTSITLAAGTASAQATAKIYVVGNNTYDGGANGSDLDNGCNFDNTGGVVTQYIDLTFNTPTGVTASPSPLRVSKCARDADSADAYTVTFTAGPTSTAGSSTITANVVSNTTSGLFDNNVSIPLTLTSSCPTTALVAPTVVLDRAASTATGWFNATTGAPVVSVTTNSANAGSLVVSLDGGATFSPYAAPFTLAEGQHSVVAQENRPASGTCSSVAGTPSAAVAADVDLSAPSVTPANVVDNAWRNTDRVQEFTGTDTGGSGLAPSQGLTADGKFTLTASAESVNNGDGTFTPTSATPKTIYDVAGNFTTRSLSALIDKTAPVVTCPIAPSYLLNASSPAAVTATVTDALSGAASSTASAAPNVSSVGSKTVSITGFDNAGNSETETCSYDVRYQLVGFFAPVDNTKYLNKAKAGQAIPFKWRVLDANNQPVLDLSAAGVGHTNLSSSASLTADAIEEYAAGSSGLQNLDDGYYQLNWKSPTAFANSSKTVTLTFPGGGALSASFTFTK